MGSRQQTGVARHVDDRSTAALFHVWNGVLASEEGTFEIRVDARVPIGFGDVRDLLHHADTCVVDEDVELTAFTHRRVDQFLHVRFDSDIALQLGDAQSGGLRGGRIDRIEVADEDASTMLG
jgi:hypothetical protein